MQKLKKGLYEQKLFDTPRDIPIPIPIPIQLCRRRQYPKCCGEIFCESWVNTDTKSNKNIKSIVIKIHPIGWDWMKKYRVRVLLYNAYKVDRTLLFNFNGNRNINFCTSRNGVKCHIFNFCGWESNLWYQKWDQMV